MNIYDTSSSIEHLKKEKEKPTELIFDIINRQVDCTNRFKDTLESKFQFEWDILHLNGYSQAISHLL